MVRRKNDEIMKNHNEYLREVHAGNDADYRAEMERRRQQFVVPLEQIQ